jgi:NSS family neurotransmitter:Na+ symporter
MITYVSYLDKEENLLTTAISIPILDTLAALIAGFATIPAVFALGFEAGEGPGLMFITLPAVFASMPMGQLFCILFFLLVIFAALTSSISMLEICVSYFVDERNQDRAKATLTIGASIFLLGIPASLSLVEGSGFRLGSLAFFDVYDKLSSNILLTTGAFLLCIFVAWVVTTKEAVKEIESSGVKFKLATIWSFLLKYIVPVGVFIILISSYKDFIVSI